MAKESELAELEWQLKMNDRKIIDYMSGIRSADEHAADVAEREEIYHQIEEKEKEPNV